MPSILTHHIFGRQVLMEMPLNFKQKIQGDNHLYDLGGMGPDYLFFYHTMPWDAYKSHRWNSIGSKLHSGNVNAFYESALQSILIQPNPCVKNQMFAYFCGHLNHWALDATCHPFVYYHAGTLGKRAGVYHYEMEANIDAAILQLYYHQQAKDISIERLVAVNDTHLEAIYNIYSPSIAKIFYCNLQYNDIKLCFQSWYRILVFLKDKDSNKRKLFYKGERMLKQPHIISSHIIPNNVDDTHDVLNLRKKTWNHPCFKDEVSNESFIDLFIKARKKSIKTLTLAYEICYEGRNILDLSDYLNDATYTRGYNGKHKMRYFHNIYQQDEDYPDI